MSFSSPPLSFLSFGVPSFPQLLPSTSSIDPAFNFFSLCLLSFLFITLPFDLQGFLDQRRSPFLSLLLNSFLISSTFSFLPQHPFKPLQFPYPFVSSPFLHLHLLFHLLFFPFNSLLQNPYSLLFPSFLPSHLPSATLNQEWIEMNVASTSVVSRLARDAICRKGRRNLTVWQRNKHRWTISF